MKNLDGFRKWFDALGDAARMMVPGEAAYRVQPREAEWNRVSALAGLTPDGSIAPPPPGATINRDASPMWTTPYRHKNHDLRERIETSVVDMLAQSHVEGRSLC